MRLIMAGAAVAVALSGCLGGISTLLDFGSHPVVSKAAQGSTVSRQDMLAIQKPSQITAIRGGTAQCFDYDLQNESGKRAALYVGFTSAGFVNAYGVSSCADAVRAGYLDSDAVMKRND
ncbi:hypothetical protein [Pseudomonas gingeri]|uniref:Osmotically inducible lipoprotein OsmE n=1 Tax=Pseudomonas gingeri TaxID=117681 RepID=A0A7Y8BNZ9_9PSED|nr:hypothetical protein [Pseudomonas gingeri]NWB50652.1 hypothetical protein [Pseudomonas gingeri]